MLHYGHKGTANPFNCQQCGQLLFHRATHHATHTKTGSTEKKTYNLAEGTARCKNMGTEAIKKAGEALLYGDFLTKEEQGKKRGTDDSRDKREPRGKGRHERHRATGKTVVRCGCLVAGTRAPITPNGRHCHTDSPREVRTSTLLARTHRTGRKAIPHRQVPYHARRIRVRWTAPVSTLQTRT